MPTALVTGAPERVSDIAIALKSAGFDILAAGPISAEDTPELEANSVDCYVQLPDDQRRADGGALRRTHDVIAHELVARFDTTARLLPLLAPRAAVVLVTEGADPLDGRGGAATHPDQRAIRALVGVLAESIRRDGGRAGVGVTVVGDDRVPLEIAALAGRRPPEPEPWWLYADVEPDLDFADWRTQILCLASLGDRRHD